jgi:hypothetical protein
MKDSAPISPTTAIIAKANWDADRAWLKVHEPDWPCPAWSRAPSWRKRSYLLAAKFGKHPDDVGDHTDG